MSYKNTPTWLHLYRCCLHCCNIFESVTSKVKYTHQRERMNVKVSWHCHVNVRIWL